MKGLLFCTSTLPGSLENVNLETSNLLTNESCNNDNWRVLSNYISSMKVYMHKIIQNSFTITTLLRLSSSAVCINFY